MVGGQESKTGLVLVAISAMGGFVVTLVAVPDLPLLVELSLLLGYLVVAVFGILLGSGVYTRLAINRQFKKRERKVLKHPDLLRDLASFPDQFRWFFDEDRTLRGIYLEKVRRKLDADTQEGIGRALLDLSTTLGESWQNVEDEIYTFSRQPNWTTSWLLNVVNHVERLWQGVARLFLGFQNLAERAMGNMSLEEEKQLEAAYGDLRDRFGDVRTFYRQFLVRVNEAFNARKNLDIVPTLPQIRRPTRWER